MDCRNSKTSSAMMFVLISLSLFAQLVALGDDGLEYRFPRNETFSNPPHASFRDAQTGNNRSDPSDNGKAFSLPPVPGRKRRDAVSDHKGEPTTQHVIYRVGLLPTPTVRYQKTQGSESSTASPYDDVFLNPPNSSEFNSTNTDNTKPKNERSILLEKSDSTLSDWAEDDDLLSTPTRPTAPEIRSPSDRKQTNPNAEIEDFTSDDLSLLENDRRPRTPYQPPDIKSRSERVVPLPVVPAPADFPGYLPPDPNANTLPEPRRTFDLPKQEVVAPAPKIAPNATATVMPWHGSEMYQEYDMPTMLGPTTHIPTTSHFAGYPRDVTEHRSFRPKLTSLPERLQSRHYEFKIQPYMPSSASPLPLMSDAACHVELQYSDFSSIPTTRKPLDAPTEIATYFGKSMVETQRPWIEWWRPFYTGGMYDPGIPVFSETNLLTPSFLVYGDYRTAVGIHRFGGNPVRQWAHRLNLDMDLRLTGTERFHMFTGPLDDNGRFTRLDFSDSSNVEFEEELDFRPETAFFEGDLGAIAGSLRGTDAPFDLPFTMGIVPLLYQNGIWMEDAIVGFAVGSPWRHSRPFNWENFESTFFVGFNDITSPAFQDQDEARVFGTAWFIEAYGGYIEADYAYLDERQNLGRSYHNAAISFTRRYLGRISNSIRLIGNAGQRGPLENRTADGMLLLFENSLITAQPSNFVPYFNAFVGNGRPQSVARAGGSGDILRNTGINFESDGLTAYPTLTATGANSYGAAVGFNLLSADFRQQLVAEFAALDRYGNTAISGIAGPQYAVGARYQRTLNNRSLIRFDAINGWLDNASNIYGMRSEFRWKF